MAFTFTPDPAIGVDLRLDPTADLATTPSGDLDLIGNDIPMQNVWQAVVLRLITTLGTYLFQVDEDDNLNYGTTLRRSIDMPMTSELKQKIETEVANTVLSDPRVQQITRLEVTQTTAPDGYQIGLSIVTVSSQSVGGTITIA